MKRWLPLAVIILAAVAAIVIAERQRIADRPSPQAMLDAAAQSQHNLTRLPNRLDRLSDADEIAIGDEIATGYETEFKTSDTAHNTAVEAYLQTVGLRVASHARRKLPWKFHYIPNPGFVNAFALPGGHIFVGEGLLKLMHSEDALAGVLGHEASHIDLRHCADRVQTEARLRNLGAIGDLVGLPVEVFLAGYSKDQELEADRDGTTLAVNAGYSPLGILQLFDEFQKLESSSSDKPGSPVEEAAGLSLQTLSGYFQSHPPATTRIAQVRALINDNHWLMPPLRPLALPAANKTPTKSLR
jgi:predicted Zn-dependent protease